MASTLKINNLDTASGTTITIPTGKQLIGTDVGSVGGAGNVVTTSDVFELLLIKTSVESDEDISAVLVD